jgi:hypothetical protein
MNRQTLLKISGGSTRRSMMFSVISNERGERGA